METKKIDNVRITPGRINTMQALAAKDVCALPDGTTTSGYRITSDILALFLRHGMIREAELSERSRKKNHIVFVYVITDHGREWLNSATKMMEAA